MYSTIKLLYLYIKKKKRVPVCRYLLTEASLSQDLQHPKKK